jgi:Ribose/xylose/arabinose/galactoside ABC-type transport systems, permease components
MLAKLRNSRELSLAVVIVGISVVFSFINPSFFTLGNLFNIARASIELGIFAIGVLLVIISGGLDISFMAVAAFSMYVTTKLFIETGWQSPISIMFAVSTAIGILLGLVNAFFITAFKLPSFIVTLGTMNLFRGILLAMIGTTFLVDVPKSMIAFSQNHLVTVENSNGSTSGLHIGFLLVIIIYILASLFLKYTTLGRSIYAIGGDAVAARRVGISLNRVLCFVYAVAGGLAGFAGLMHTAMFRMSVPSDLVGNELMVIAAVVLGGASLTGGKGTVLGTFLGVLLITIIGNSLTLLKVPSYWQQLVMGVIILAGISIQYKQKKAKTAVAES